MELIRLRNLTLLLFVNFFLPLSLAEDSIVGKWKTIDDETGKAKSIVEIVKIGEIFKGRVVELLPPENPDKICSKCIGDKHDKPIKGLEIISNMKEIKKNVDWGDGIILDPKNGKTYKGHLKLKDSKTLEVRGYIGISLFGRSQTWFRE